MKNYLSIGFNTFYSSNEKHLPYLEFNEDTGDLKRVVESTTDQLVDVEPVSIQLLPDRSISNQDDKNVVIKEDETTIGEKIIADDDNTDDPRTEQVPDGTPAGTTVSTESIKTWKLDDFLGEDEYYDDIDEEDKSSITPKEMKVKKISDTFFSTMNAVNLASLSHASDAISKKLGNVYYTLRHEISPVVDTLTNEIDDEVAKLNSNNNTILMLKNNEFVNKNLKVVDWKELWSLGTIEDIVQHVKHIGNLKSDSIINFSSARIALGKLSKNIDESNIPDNVKNNIITTIKDITDNDEAGIDKVSSSTMPENDVSSIKLEGDDIMSTEHTDKQSNDYSPEDEYTQAFEYLDTLQDRRKYLDSEIATEGLLSKLKNMFIRAKDRLTEGRVVQQADFIDRFKPDGKTDFKDVNRSEYFIAKKDMTKFLSEYDKLCNLELSLISDVDKFISSYDIKNVATHVDKARNAYSSYLNKMREFRYLVLNVKDAYQEQEISTSGYTIKEVKAHSKKVTMNATKIVRALEKLYKNVEIKVSRNDDTTSHYRNAIYDLCDLVWSILLGIDAFTFYQIPSDYRIVRQLARVMGVESFRMDDFLGEDEYYDDTDKKNKDNKDAVAEVYGLVTSNARYYQFINFIKESMTSYNTSTQVMKLLPLLKTYPKIVKAFESTYLDISDIDQKKIQNNAMSVQYALYCTGLYLLACRKYFAEHDVLVLDEKHVNDDVMKEYTSEGGTTNDIDLHIHYNYTLPSKPIPNMGIRGFDILRHKNRIATEHMSRADNTKKMITNEYTKMVQYAYNQVLSKYLKSIPQDKIPDNMSQSQFVSNKYSLVRESSVYLNNPRYSVENCVWKFLLKLWYNKQRVYMDMYNRLENQYMELFNETDAEIDEKDIATTDAKVIADMTIDFLFKYCVKQ